MESTKTPSSLYGYAFLLLGGVVLMCVSVGTTHWLDVTFRYNGESHKLFHIGLFKFCVETNETCLTIDDSTVSPKAKYAGSVIDACKGLCFTSLVMGTLTVFIMGHLVHKVFMKKETLTSKIHGGSTMLITMLAGGLAAGSAIHYMVKVGWPPFLENISWSFGYSMYLSIVSGGLTFFAGVLAFITSWEICRNHIRATFPQPQVMAVPGMQVVTPVMYTPGTHPPQQYAYPVGGQPFVQNTGQPFVQNTGQPFVQNTGQPLMQNAGQPLMQNTGQPVLFAQPPQYTAPEYQTKGPQ